VETGTAGAVQPVGSGPRPGQSLEINDTKPYVKRRSMTKEKKASSPKKIRRNREQGKEREKLKELSRKATR
jgi:hypothetical protein